MNKNKNSCSICTILIQTLLMVISHLALVESDPMVTNNPNTSTGSRVVAMLYTSFNSSNIGNSSEIWLEKSNNGSQMTTTNDSLAEKITGKLIYAKMYDQIQLDKILNKSDTYYKNNMSVCSCVSVSGSISGQEQRVALIDQSTECTSWLWSALTADKYIKCARDLNVLALLIYDHTNTNRNFLLFGLPIEVIRIENLLAENLTYLLTDTTTNKTGTIFASIDSLKTSKSLNNVTASAIASSTQNSHVMPVSSILAIVFGVLLVILLLVGLFSVFFYLQKARLREEREKLEDLIEKLTKRAISRMETKVIKPDDDQIKHNEVCVICMENYKHKDVVRILPCGHYFHKHEIDMWISKNHTCPVCKIDILKADIDKTTSSWYRLAVRLHLAKSPYELHEAVQTYNNYRRHYSFDSDRRYSSINQNTVTSVISTEETRSRVFSEFVTLHQKRYSLTAYNNALKNEEWPSGEGRPKRIRRLNFFGETLDDFHDDFLDDDNNNNEDLAEHQQVVSDATASMAAAFTQQSSISEMFYHNSDPLSKHQAEAEEEHDVVQRKLTPCAEIEVTNDKVIAKIIDGNESNPHESTITTSTSAVNVDENNSISSLVVNSVTHE